MRISTGALCLHRVVIASFLACSAGCMSATPDQPLEIKLRIKRQGAGKILVASVRNRSGQMLYVPQGVGNDARPAAYVYSMPGGAAYVMALIPPPSWVDFEDFRQPLRYVPLKRGQVIEYRLGIDKAIPEHRLLHAAPLTPEDAEMTGEEYAVAEVKRVYLLVGSISASLARRFRDEGIVEVCENAGVPLLELAPKEWALAVSQVIMRADIMPEYAHVFQVQVFSAGFLEVEGFSTMYRLRDFDKVPWR